MSIFLLTLNNELSQITHKDAGVFYPHKLDFLNHLMIGCNINSSTVMMKMELFTNIGLFNEVLKFTQDYAFWLRAIQHYEFYYLNEPLVKYRVHDNMGTKKYNKEIDIEIKKLNQKYEKSMIILIKNEGGKK